MTKFPYKDKVDQDLALCHNNNQGDHFSALCPNNKEENNLIFSNIVSIEDIEIEDTDDDFMAMCQNINNKEYNWECYDDKFKHVMMYDLELGKGPSLPKVFKLNNPFPGEPPFKKLRMKPVVL